MPYTIVGDGDEICIRATISQRWELAELVTKLQQRVDGLPVDITTMIIDAEASIDVDDKGVIQKVIITNPGPGHAFDAHDANRKELKNER